MISVQVDLRLKEKQVILSPNTVFSESEQKTLKELGYRANNKGQFIGGYDVYNLTKGLFKAVESEAIVNYLKELEKEAETNNTLLNLYMDTKCPLPLYPFQREFVLWFNNPLKTRSSVMNCCEPGLGKTAMSLAAVLGKEKETPLIILCPKNAIGNWIKHLKMFGYTLPVTDSFNPEEKGACILTYESLPPLKSEANEKKRFMENFKLLPNTVLIADEFHKCKNSKAKKTKRFNKLFKLIKAKEGKCIALTGTPIMSYESDLKTLLNNIDLFKYTFGKADVFNKLYGGEFNWATKRMTWNPELRQSEEIKKRISSVVFMKKKKDVYEQLPEIIETKILLDLSIPKEDKKLLDSLNSNNPTDIKMYQKIRASLAKAKFNRALETIEDYEEQEKTIIVFSWFKETVELLGKRKGWKYVTGDTPAKEREKIFELINEGKYNGAITIGAGSMAANIPNVDTALFIDLSLTPGDNDQARGRIDRISNIKDKLHYVYFITDHPFEKAQYKNLMNKISLINDAFDWT